MKPGILFLEDDAFFAQVVKKHLEQTIREIPRLEEPFTVQLMQRYHHIHFFLSSHTRKSYWTIPDSSTATPSNNKPSHHHTKTYSIALGEVAALLQHTYAHSTSDNAIINQDKSSFHDLNIPLAATLPDIFLQAFLTWLQNMVARAINKIKRLFKAALRSISTPANSRLTLHLRTVFRILKLHPDDGKNEDNDHTLPPC